MRTFGSHLQRVSFMDVLWRASFCLLIDSVSDRDEVEMTSLKSERYIVYI